MTTLAMGTFRSWWEDFRRIVDEGDPHRAAARLTEHLEALPAEDRRPFLTSLLDALLQHRHAYGVALFSLEGLRDSAYLYDFAAHLRPLPDLQSDDEECHLSDLIRILAAADDPVLLQAVESYLMERRIGPHWSSVPWALWPHRKNLFGQAWKRFFLERAASESGNAGVLSPFLAEPEAVRVVRSYVESASPDDWLALRDSLERHAAGAQWLSREQREELDRAIE